MNDLLFHWYFVINQKYRDFMEGEDGISGLVVSLILILIAVAMAYVFKEELTKIIRTVLGKVEGDVGNIMSQP